MIAALTSVTVGVLSLSYFPSSSLQKPAWLTRKSKSIFQRRSFLPRQNGEPRILSSASVQPSGPKSFSLARNADCLAGENFLMGDSFISLANEFHSSANCCRGGPPLGGVLFFSSRVTLVTSNFSLDMGNSSHRPVVRSHNSMKSLSFSMGNNRLQTRTSAIAIKEINDTSQGSVREVSEKCRQSSTKKPRASSVSLCQFLLCLIEW